MQIVQLVQGSPEWHAHRGRCFNASDVPAMLGISPYKSRSQLLKEMATGVSQEVDAQTQRRFDDGHRFEALARPIAEQILGDDLYPIIAVEDKYGLSRPLSASSDGLNMAVTKNFEHKSLNADLRRVFENDEPLPELYTSQMEAQHMVFGDVETLFMASKFNDNDELLEKFERAYKSDSAMRERILAGWAQFQKDLAEYVHSEVEEMPKAEVTIELPALFIQAQGEIIDSNMIAYGEALIKKLAEVRAIKLVTDQDFSNAKEAAKLFREQCKKLELTKEAMLSQTVTIGEAARMMDAWHEDLRVTALKLEKDVEKEDLAKKRLMVTEAALAFSAHVEALEAETRPLQLLMNAKPDFAAAIKGKRNYTSMQDAVNTELASAKIVADAVAKDVRAKLSWYNEATNLDNGLYGFLFADLQQIIIKPVDDFKLTVTSRIEQHQKAEAAKLEAERARMQAQEEAKARAKVEAEQRAAAEAEAVEERRKAVQLADQEKAHSSAVEKQEVKSAGKTGLTLSGKAADGKEGLVRVRPTRESLVKCIAFEFGVEIPIAEGWLREAFTEVAA